MSITDELREYTKHYSVAGSKKDTMLSTIADHIDAEHEREVDEAKGTATVYMPSQCVALPVDADGEPIHIGDVMKPKLFGETSFEVRSIRCDECGWEVTDRLGDRYEPLGLRHHHEPTVEDMLLEMVEKAVGYSDAHTTVALNAITEYAKRIREVLRDE